MTSYSQLSDSELSFILSHYDVGGAHATACTPLAGGWANSNFRVVLSDARSVCVKVCDEKTPAALDASLCAVQHVAKHRFPTCGVWPTRTGERVASLNLRCVRVR